MHSVRTKSLLIVASIVLAAGLPLNCDHSSHSKHEHAGEHHGHGQGKLALNAAKRWQADTPTRAGMKALKATVDSRYSHKRLTAKDRLALRAKVKADVSVILKKCTMKGQGHNELHKYIALLLKDAEALSTATDKNGPARVKKVREDILLFERYFE